MKKFAIRPNDFAFIAFNEKSGKIMAHGAQAIYALASADRIEAGAYIKVLGVGSLGTKIWNHQASLADAEALIASSLRAAL